MSAVSERAASDNAVSDRAQGDRPASDRAKDHGTVNSGAGPDSFGQRVLATAAGTLLAAPLVYLGAVAGGYAKAESRPLYVAVIPLVVVGALWAARSVVRDRRPEVFFVAAVGGAVVAVVTTAVATWFQTMAADLAASATKANSDRDFAIGIVNAKEAAERVHWSDVTSIFGVCAVLFLVVFMASTIASPAGRRVVRSGSVDKVALATVAAAGLTIVVCGWLLYRL